jgi:hypothetical protein
MTGRSTQQRRQADDSSRFSAAVTRRHELYVRLDALSRRQSACVESEDTSVLLEVLAEREGIVQEIVGLSQEIERWGAPERLLGALGVAERDRVEKADHEASRLASTILERDEADRLILEERRAALSAEMSGVSNGRTAMAAYGGRGRPGPRMQDRNG